MDLALTLSLGVLVIAVGVISAWRGARPPDPLRGPRLIPWRFIMLVCGAMALYLAAHALNLVGVTTGR